MSASGHDIALIDDIRRGNHAAAAAMVQRHNRGLCVSRAASWAMTPMPRKRRRTPIWLARIVINEALRRVERRRPTVDLADVARELPNDPACAGPEHAAARAEIQRMLEQAVDALPAEFRAVFMMRVIEQLSTEETAALRGISQAMVKTRLHRANERLRAALGVEFAAILEDSFPFGGARCERLTRTVLALMPPPA